MTYILNKLLLLPGIIIGLSFHEAAHAKVSNMLGDPTPKLQGRVTLNPLAHIDVMGFIALLIFGFGWGKPVQVDPRYYKNKRRDEFLVSIAGVCTNLVVAVVFAFISGFAYRAFFATNSYVMYYIFNALFYVVTINLCLMVFNLIPVPPLDGWGILTQIFDLEKYSWYSRIYQYGSLILVALIIFNVTDLILTPALTAMTDLLTNVFF